MSSLFAALLVVAPAAAHPLYGPPPMPLSSDLKYYGGRVISNVDIVEIAWGSGVDPTYLTNLQGFYTFIVTSPFIDWMTEYDTIGLTGFADLQPGSNQHIGRGIFGGSFVITPSNKSTTLTDDDVQAEFALQLTNGSLPAPTVDVAGNVNSLYMFEFPSGISITLLGGPSCSSFGAYHGTIVYGGQSVPYGVHPSCGYSFDQATIVHSHELAESITDMEVGLVEYNMTNPNERPLAWDTLASTAWASQEAGDLCEGTSAKIGAYSVQKIWSNYAQACVAEIPICDGVLVPPACRPCNAYDSGNACTNACATSGPKEGQCVPCTTAYPNACGGAMPVCDDATYTCVGCVTSRDCAGALPTCDETSHTCRACTQDGDCGGSDAGVCDTSSDPTKGQCVACNVDTQCKPSERCMTHVCTPTPIPEAGPEVGDQEPIGGSTSGCGCTTAGAPSPRLAWGLILLALRRRRSKG